MWRSSQVYKIISRYRFRETHYSHSVDHSSTLTASRSPVFVMSGHSNYTKCAARKQQRTALLAETTQDAPPALPASASKSSCATEMINVRQTKIYTYFKPITTRLGRSNHLLAINRDDRIALRAHLTNTRVTEILPAQYGTFVDVELSLLSPTGSARGEGSAVDVDLEKGVDGAGMKKSRRTRRKVKLEPIRPEWWMWIIIVWLAVVAVAEVVWMVRVW